MITLSDENESGSVHEFVVPVYKEKGNNSEILGPWYDILDDWVDRRVIPKDFELGFDSSLTQPFTSNLQK